MHEEYLDYRQRVVLLLKYCSFSKIDIIYLHEVFLYSLLHLEHSFVLYTNFIV